MIDTDISVISLSISLSLSLSLSLSPYIYIYICIYTYTHYLLIWRRPYDRRRHLRPRRQRRGLARLVRISYSLYYYR